MDNFSKTVSAVHNFTLQQTIDTFSFTLFLGWHILAWCTVLYSTVSRSIEKHENKISLSNAQEVEKYR